MIATLRGTLHRLDPTEVIVDVQGVGYRVTVPVDVFEGLEEGTHCMLWVSTYVREDRLDLYGFCDRAGRTLFEEFLNIAGVGPKMALELCAVPRELLMKAVLDEDPAMLTNIKGVGRKTAEKLLLELKSLHEKNPNIFGASPDGSVRADFDHDAVAALANLGYDTSSIMKVLKDLPKEVQTTEERVAAALRSL